MDTVGQRIKLWRRRRGGMSQRVLADLAGLSQGYVSQIESGTAPLDRKATQAAIANALNISVAQLLGQRGDPEDPLRSRTAACIPGIRNAIIELGHSERRTPVRDQDSVREAVRRVTDLRNALDYIELAPILADLLLDLGGHDGVLAPELIEALFAVQVVLRNLGCEDLARQAAELGVRVAEDHADPGWIGQALYSLAWEIPPESRDFANRLAVRAAGELQAFADRESCEAYGRLHLLLALHAAAAEDADSAQAHLDEAADVALFLGEPERYGSLSAGVAGSWFGPTNVKLWQESVAVELRDVGTALAVADQIDLSAVPVPNRHVYFHADRARALAVDGKHDREAMQALAQAERSAPAHFRLNPVMRDMVATLISRARRKAVAEEMQALARRLGLDPL